MKENGVSVVKDGLRDMAKALQTLTQKQVLVGVPAANNAREDAAGAHSDFGNAAIGYLSEYGRPEANIPARPHLIPGVRKIDSLVIRLLKEAATAALSADDNGKSASQRDQEIDKSLTKVGLACVGSIQEVIQAGIAPSLAAATISRRANRAAAPREGTTPLIDTGAYLHSITFVLDKKPGSTKELPRAISVEVRPPGMPKA